MVYDNEAAFKELDEIRSTALAQARKSKKFRLALEDALKNYTDLKNNGKERVLIGNKNEHGNDHTIFYGFIRKHWKSHPGYEAKRNEIVENNIGLVISAINKIGTLSNPEYDKDDLLQEGKFGLTYAADMFDVRSGNKFSTFAFIWVRQSIMRFVESNVSALHVPVYVVRDSWSNGTQVPKSHQVPSSRDEDNENNFFEAKVDRTRSKTEAIEDADCISVGMSLLSKPERDIIKYRFGLFGEFPHNLNDTGAKVGLSKERVRQIEEIAMEKLKALGPTVFGMESVNEAR